MRMTDRFIDIARRVDPAQVGDALQTSYEMKDDGVRWHLDALAKLCGKEPAEPDGTTICVRLVKNEESEAYPDVSGVKDGDDTVYSLSLTPWAEWASMPVRVVGTDMSEAQVVAHCLWEMTWHGDEEQGAEFKAELIDQIEEIKSRIDDEE